jgi:hypothetical protein
MVSRQELYLYEVCYGYSSIRVDAGELQFEPLSTAPPGV